MFPTISSGSSDDIKAHTQMTISSGSSDDMKADTPDTEITFAPLGTHPVQPRASHGSEDFKGSFTFTLCFCTFE